jgi:phospholipase D1/2
MALQVYFKCGVTETLISQMEANSGVTFYEAQTALARQWEGPRYTGGDAPKEVFIKVPQPAQEGMALSQTKMKMEKVPLPASYDDAVDIVRRFEQGSDDIRGDEDVSDTISQHRLLDRTSLNSEIWYGSEAEERDAYVHVARRWYLQLISLKKLRVGTSLYSLEGYDR